MKSRVVVWLSMCAVVCTLMAASAMAGPRFGEYDRGHVWRDAGWWHDRYPGWLYSHHPEWVVERRDWWWYDHQSHPDWFWAPVWGVYPRWSWGAPYQGVYHDYWWWHQYHPDWMYAHHPEWAEPYGRWMRDDYGRHPEWFASNYWRDHPRDWAHPDKEFWHHEDGRFKDYLGHHPEDKNRDRRELAVKTDENKQGGSKQGPPGERHNGPAQPFHPAPQPVSHPAAGGVSGGEQKKK